MKPNKEPWKEMNAKNLALKSLAVLKYTFRLYIPYFSCKF